MAELIEIDEEYLAHLKKLFQSQVRGNQSKIKTFVKNIAKIYYDDSISSVDGDGDCKIKQFEACCFGHIYNQDKIKTLKSFKKLNDYTSETIDDILFNGHTLTLTVEDTVYKGEEAFRLNARFSVLYYSIIEMMIKIMDKFQLWKIF